MQITEEQVAGTEVVKEEVAITGRAPGEDPEAAPTLSQPSSRRFARSRGVGERTTQVIISEIKVDRSHSVPRPGRQRPTRHRSRRRLRNYRHQHRSHRGTRRARRLQHVAPGVVRHLTTYRKTSSYWRRSSKSPSFAPKIRASISACV